LLYSKGYWHTGKDVAVGTRGTGMEGEIYNRKAVQSGSRKRNKTGVSHEHNLD
jgi:hypothetical protein